MPLFGKDAEMESYLKLLKKENEKEEVSEIVDASVRCFRSLLPIFNF